MKTFLCRFKDETGRSLHMLIPASSAKEAKRHPAPEGYFFVSLKSFSFETLTKKKINLRKLIMFTNRLATLIDAGIPILRAMSILWHQSDDLTIQLITQRIHADLERGGDLSTALAQFPNAFPPIFVSLIKVGEKSGTLPKILERLVQYLETKDDLITRTKKATIYPVVVIFFAIFVVLGLFIFIVPRFVSVLEKLNTELPWITKIILKLSEIIRSYPFWAVAFTGIVLLIYFYRESRRDPKLQFVIDKIATEIPYVGHLIISISMSQAMRSLSIMLGSGINALESLDISMATANNRFIMQKFQKVRMHVEQGSSLYEAFKKDRFFPVIITEMIGVGEMSGEIVHTLEHVTRQMEKEVDYEVNKVLTMLEPALIVVVGGIVLTVLISIYAPITSIWQGLMK